MGSIVGGHVLQMHVQATSIEKADQTFTEMAEQWFGFRWQPDRGWTVVIDTVEGYSTANAGGDRLVTFFDVNGYAGHVSTLRENGHIT